MCILHWSLHPATHVPKVGSHRREPKICIVGETLYTFQISSRRSGAESLKFCTQNDLFLRTIETDQVTLLRTPVAVLSQSKSHVPKCSTTFGKRRECEVIPGKFKSLILKDYSSIPLIPNTSETASQAYDEGSMAFARLGKSLRCPWRLMLQAACFAIAIFQHSGTLTAKPPRDVSLYLTCMSAPVCRIVSMT